MDTTRTLQRCEGFLQPYVSFHHRNRLQQKNSIATIGDLYRSSTTDLSNTKNNGGKRVISEYSVAEEEDDDEEEEEEEEDNDKNYNSKQSELVATRKTTASTTVNDERLAHPEPGEPKHARKQFKHSYAAMEPGTVVQIQVGDVSLARKAWKKRRRTGSPLLVPCSVLYVDRKATIRWNLIYLLEKFGASHSSGIRLSLSSLTSRYRNHLQSSLTKQASIMGYGSAGALVEALFPKQVQDTYGVRLIADNDDSSRGKSGTIWLQAPLSRSRAQKRARSAAVLQFQDGNPDTFQHTGLVRIRQQEDGDGGDHNDDENIARLNSPYQLKPLSAALRVTQEDVESGTVQDGSLHACVVFDFDQGGDNGAPLLTLSLNPSRNQVRDRLKIIDRKHQIIRNPKYLLHELRLGDGPLTGKVIKLVKGGALVDCRIGRVRGQPSDEAMNVLGMLRFRDAVTIDTVDENDVYDEEEDDDLQDVKEQDWDEILSVNDDDDDDDDDNNNNDDDDDGDSSNLNSIMKQLESDEEFMDSEDITHLFQVNDDGTLTYRDPETGEEHMITMADDNDDEEDEEEEEAAIPTREPILSRKGTDQRPQNGNPKTPRKLPSRRRGLAYTEPRSHTLRQGDRVNVYIKSVSRQSSQIHFTMNSSVQGCNAKELKRESEVDKKMNRLLKQLGGMDRIEKLRGYECDGIVKATSNTGDWLYVQPLDDLPVGVAQVEEKDLIGTLEKGASLRITIDGIDQGRGQLAMRVIRKL